MKIRVPITHYEEVQVSGLQAKEIALSVIHQAFNLPTGSYADGAELVVDEEHHTSHSWTTKVRVRKMTKADMVALEVISHIRDFNDAK